MLSLPFLSAIAAGNCSMRILLQNCEQEKAIGTEEIEIENLLVNIIQQPLMLQYVPPLMHRSLSL